MPGYISRLTLGLVLAVAFASAGSAVGPGVATDWRSTNYDESANRYSPLAQITSR